jgi:glycerophosphoryl diester phosphodiesterase
MIGKDCYRSINHRLNQLLKEKKILLAVHRGSSAGNIIENTIPAYLASLKMGGDILEADVVLSKDKEIYHFHSGMERKNFQKAIDIQTCTATEIEALTYINSNLEETAYPVEKLETTLNYFKGKCLINIDRGWNFLPEICELVEKTGTTDQILLKGPLTKEVTTFLQESEIKYMFMPKVSTLEELDQVDALRDINVVGLEVKAINETSDFFQKENIQKIKEKGLFVWVNSLTMDDQKQLFAGYDDNTSILEGEENGWSVIFDKGANVIQTDWPTLVAKSRDTWLERQGHL